MALKEQNLEVLLGAKGKTLWVETPKGNLSWGKSILDLEEEEEEGYLKRRNGFHLHPSPLFLFFLIFYVCIYSFNELISFSRVLM